jgi:sorting nexin-4
VLRVADPLAQHDISTSPPLSDLPKSSLRAPVRSPADPQASRAYAALPLPGAATPLRVPNARFADSEAFTNRWTAHVAGPLEKGNRRIVKRWGGEWRA